MWVALSLLAALTFAFNNLTIKASVEHADVILSSVVFRIGSGFLLLGVVLAAGPWPEATPGYIRALLLILPAEIAGLVFMALALREGDLSLVQPIVGLIPVFVTLGGVVVLGEVPSVAAALGVVLVAAGVYTVGLGAGRSLLDPLRALASSRASWFALGASLSWSVCTIIHKFGIAEVGPIPWGVSVIFASALSVGVALPFLARRKRGMAMPGRGGRWWALMAAAAVTFAAHVYTLQRALVLAPAGYVIALSSTSTLLAVGLGIVYFRERSGARNRLAGAFLVTTGAVLIAALG